MIIPFLLANLGVGVWIVCIAMGIGLPLAGRWAPRGSTAIQLSLGFLVGVAILSHVIMVFGLLGWLRRAPLLGMLAVLTVPFVAGIRPLWRRLRALGTDWRSGFAQGNLPDRAVLLAFVAATFLSVAIPLLPVTNTDALAYTTALPSRFVSDGRMRFYADGEGSTWILLIENFHMLGYGLGLLPLGEWMEVAAQALLLFAMAEAYVVFTGKSDPRGALVAAAVLMLIPLTQMMPFMTKGHLTELLALVVCFTLVLEAPEKGGWVGIAASAAVAIAVKYSAGVGLLALIVPGIILRARAQFRSLRGRDLAGMLIIGLLLAAPAYVRNWFWTGNPFFPVKIPFFSSPFHMHQHDVWMRSVRTDSGYGIGVKDLFLWWFRAATIPNSGLGFYMGPFFLTFLPLSLTASPRPRHFQAAVLGFATATVVLFLSTGQFERYFLAAILPMALLAAAGWQGLRARRRFAFAFGYLLVLGVGLGLTLPLKAYGLLRQAPALVSRAGVERVLAQNTPFYEDLVQVRRVIPPAEPVVCLIRTCQYLTNFRREDVVTRLVEEQSAAALPDPRIVWRGLQAQGLHHLLMIAPETVSDDPPRPATLLGWLSRCGGKIVYRNQQARMGVRNPHNVKMSDLVVIKLSDRLDLAAERLEGRCAMDGVLSR